MVAESQPGHIDQIKQANAGSVYRLIDRLGPISRIDLSRHAQLAPASITKIVREMLEAHLIQETEIQEPGSRGRPAIGLCLDTAAWHFLAVNISRNLLVLSLRDLSCREVVSERLPLPQGDPRPLLTRLVSHVDQFFTRNQHRLERLTAIAITSPGIIDSTSGVVHSMPFYDVNELPLAEALNKRTGLPIFVHHDISAWTLAESLFGASQGANDVIQVVIDHNVGAGVITGGRLLHGQRSSVVEIGHTQVDPYGQRCYCGNHGCLETVASIDSILATAAQRMAHSPGSMLHQQPLTIEALCEAARDGDLLACDIIEGVGHSVGRIVAVMVNLFNPQKILIGSPLNQAAEVLHPAILTCIHQQSLPAYGRHLSLESTELGSGSTLAGAALVKEAMYNGSLLIRLLQG
ncbi:transcriptional regulator [Salmonella enterica subsp. enterica serovar Choleraesuis]|nr:transcriptional regulator [Salmonella enterica subsp. enterica serovar Choleraesuis]